MIEQLANLAEAAFWNVPVFPIIRNFRPQGDHFSRPKPWQAISEEPAAHALFKSAAELGRLVAAISESQDVLRALLRGIKPRRAQRISIIWTPASAP